MSRAGRVAGEPLSTGHADELQVLAEEHRAVLVIGKPNEVALLLTFCASLLGDESLKQRTERLAKCGKQPQGRLFVLPVDIRRQLLAPFIVGDEPADLGAFLQYLLLFETYVISSQRLREIPALVSAFGVDAVARALNSGAVRIDYITCGIAEGGEKGIHNRPMNFRLLAYRAYGPPATPNQPPQNLSAAQHAARDLDYKIREAFGSLPQLTLYERNKLEGAIRRSVVATTPSLEADALRDALRELQENVGLVRRAIAYKAREIVGADPPPFTVRVEPVHGDIVHVEIDLAVKSEEQLSKIAQGACLAVANLSYRVAQMRGFNAVCGFRDPERPFLDAKLAFAMESSRDAEQEKQLSRVLDIAGLPDLGESATKGSVDLDKLLSVRASRECAEFREWLRTLDSVSDDELRERIRSVRSRLGEVYESLPVRAIRLAVASAIPGLGGVVAGGIDDFVAKKIFAKAGPLAFLNDKLPTIFK